MPTLADYHATNRVKMLNIGESKSGKTGCLASLVIAGYNLHILDYDNNLRVLLDVLSEKAPDKLSHVRYETLRDGVKFINGKPQLIAPVHAYKDAGKVLTEWDTASLTSKDVLVLDTLSTFSDAGFNEACALGGRLNQRPQLQDYGWMADSVKLFIEHLTSDALSCHLIVNTHIRYFSGNEEDQTTARGLPNAKGQEISRIVSRYFETVVLTRTQGQGPGAKRIISTQPQGVVEVAAPPIKRVKSSYPVETGMADLFADILGHGPTPPVHGSSPRNT